MKPADVKICMNAMVGSEEKTITRMLNSVADYIDYYVVQCNGKDNTKQIIDDFFAERNIPGFTYEIDWDYPGWNRDHTLQKALQADHGCDWILRMDADEQLVVEEDFDWSPLRDTTIQSFNIVADPGDSMYYRTWLWNAKLPWFFAHDKRHETIHLPDAGESFQRVTLSTGFRQIITNDGDTWFAPMKFLKDALELESDKVPSNKVLEDNYHLWYIGKSYSDAYGDHTQFPFGMDHAKEYARRCIFYFNMYLNRLHNYSETNRPSQPDDMGYYAMMLIGRAQSFIGDNDLALQTFERANEFNSMRNEANVERCLLLERMERYEEMMKLSFSLIKPGGAKKNPFPESSFLIHKSAYYDTSAEPFWIHIRSLNHLGKSFQTEEEWMKRQHPNLPDYITYGLSSLKGENRIEETNTPVVESVTETKANPIALTGVFGITK